MVVTTSDRRLSRSVDVPSAGDTGMNASADGQGRVFQAGRDIVISGQPHANARKLTVLNVEAAAQVLTEMAGNAKTRDEAVLTVADMEPGVAASRLAAMPPESAAQILARMDHRLARQRLLLIPSWGGGEGGAILGHLPARVAAKLVEDVPRDTTLSLLGQIAPKHAAAILAEFPDSLAGEIIITNPANYTREEYTLEGFLAHPFSTEYAATWLLILPLAQAARVVAAASAEATAVIFACMSDEALVGHGSGLLSKVDVSYLVTVLAFLQPVWRAGALLSGLADDRVAAALADLPETRCAVLLARLPEERAAEIVRQLPETKQQAVKPHLW
ncbi:hypothetical protein O7543_04240 [Solwaraspora sp. WMMA2080]|uniref:hypothetical protein n=1 Tax=unclassified Solwaraspora TaxID=2627926 RepID=UPI00248BFEBE|nr:MULTISPECIES: hypothetical protein [unclassified Solwaraspora]WBB99753.1 hypothetical protein O7553_13130 [Solwaraspora sp. WMMA2059]WBC21697.1 hypothetical protein O7543_04240 [Solwaraspora sp. WMMA2080]